MSACSPSLKAVSVDHIESIELGLPAFNDGLFEIKPVISDGPSLFNKVISPWTGYKQEM